MNLVTLGVIDSDSSTCEVKMRGFEGSIFVGVCFSFFFFLVMVLFLT